jgi:hypothetical protein
MEEVLTGWDVKDEDSGEVIRHEVFRPQIIVDFSCYKSKLEDKDIK